jgi:hypothetical protein
MVYQTRVGDWRLAGFHPWIYGYDRNLNDERQDLFFEIGPFPAVAVMAL